MGSPSRRHFLAATGAGAVAVGAATIAPGSLAEAATDVDQARSTDELLGDEPLIASVDDLAAGTVSVMHGDREITVTDHALARRIAAIAGSEA